jgi:hypothetical protein
MKRLVALLVLCCLGGCATLPAPRAAQPDRLPGGVIAEPERFILVTLRNEPVAVASRAGSTIRGYDIAGRYSLSPKARGVARALEREYRLREVSSWPIVALRVHCILYELPRDAAREAVLAQLARRADVELAQPLQTFTTAGSSSGYNDPYVDLQRSLYDMDIPAAHRWSRGHGVRVAVVDTGIDTRHPDLAGRVVLARNFIDDDSGRFDGDRHGTEVAGLIGALADNGEGIVGVAPEVEILALKSCWQLRPDADDAVCNSFTLAQGLAAAIEADAHIINLSVVGPEDMLLAELVSQASRRGIIVVGAASPSGEVAGFPAWTPGVIAVDVARPLSNSLQLIYAPGNDVLTLTPAGGYGFGSGSSLATAHVSGVVALLRSRDPRLRSDQVRHLLTAATQRVSTALGELRSINACAALAEMLAEGPCPEPRNVSASAPTD